MNLSFFAHHRGIRFFILGLLVAFLFLNSGFISSLASATSILESPISLASPMSNHTNTTGPTLRVMSWNAYFLNKTSAAFIQEVDELHPDIIAIQELGQGLMDVILDELQDEYPYMELHPSKTPAGSAVLSRYPFQSTTVPDYDVWSGCNCQVVTLEINGELITMINAHPWPPKVAIGGSGDWSNLFTLDTTAQDPIFDKIIARIDAISSPLIVVGDFNTMPFQPNIQRIKTRLTDAFYAAGSGAGYTFPAQATDHNLPPHPFMRLDYIFHSAAWQTIDAWTDAIPGSDHQYVIADLRLQ